MPRRAGAGRVAGFAVIDGSADHSPASRSNTSESVGAVVTGPGSITGAVRGGLLLGVISDLVLIPLPEYDLSGITHVVYGASPSSWRRLRQVSEVVVSIALRLCGRAVGDVLPGPFRLGTCHGPPANAECLPHRKSACHRARHSGQARRARSMISSSCSGCAW